MPKKTKKEIVKTTKDAKDTYKLRTIQTFYANLFQPRWREDEFVLEFGQTPTDDDDFAPSSRIFIPPEFIPIIIEALQETYRDYKKEFGKTKKKNLKS